MHLEMIEMLNLRFEQYFPCSRNKDIPCSSIHEYILLLLLFLYKDNNCDESPFIKFKFIKIILFYVLMSFQNLQ